MEQALRPGYRRVMSASTSGRPVTVVALRRCALAVSVLDDIPIEPREHGVLLGLDWDDPVRTTVPWVRLEQALAGADPETTTGRLRLRDWMRARTALTAEPSTVRRRLVPLGLPAGHALHPGPAWVREPVPGGLIGLGLGLRVAARSCTTGAGADDAVVALAPSVLACAGLDARHWWPPVRERLDELALLAIERLTRDDGGLLTPTGGCDVLTLLGSRWLREHLAGGDGTGMRALAAPMRTRAWFDLARIDPAFVAAAAAATDEEHRGVSRPLLVTADEVALAPAATPHQLARLALLDAAAADPMLPGVLR